MSRSIMCFPPVIPHSRLIFGHATYSVYPSVGMCVASTLHVVYHIAAGVAIVEFFLYGVGIDVGIGTGPLERVTPV
jgi:hypothetical protein